MVEDVAAKEMGELGRGKGGKRGGMMGEGERETGRGWREGREMGGRDAGGRRGGAMGSTRRLCLAIRDGRDLKRRFDAMAHRLSSVALVGERSRDGFGPLEGFRN
jgi:hypothetical protein